MSEIISRTLVTGVILALVTTAPAGAQTVTLNGAPVALNPAPQTRAGRVFVPLRGVFERLGASVVYANGTINAQGNNHSVSLHIGSTQATVDGQPQVLDVAPFIIGASTYVPLRFVSTALGASVNYDAANDVVALGMGAPAQAAPPPQPQHSALTVRSLQPARDASVGSQRPTIEARFAGAPANPNSIKVELDGLNVTDQSTRSPSGIVFSPPSDLQAGRHEVAVSGTDAQGLPFLVRWQFASGTSPVSNEIRDLSPANGAAVGASFTVSGQTLPGARVIVQVGTANDSAQHNLIGEIIGAAGGQSSVRSEVIADGNGRFSTPISIAARPGQTLTVVVDSSDARTQAAAPRIVRNLIVQ
jgi:hypothetical protein